LQARFKQLKKNYFFKGICKFGSHEAFKIVHANALREEDAYVYRSGLYLSASATTDIVLSPREVKAQSP
jgi:solute carrier family 25 phosphate transporter 3